MARSGCWPKDPEDPRPSFTKGEGPLEPHLAPHLGGNRVTSTSELSIEACEQGEMTNTMAAYWAFRPAVAGIEGPFYTYKPELGAYR